MSRSVARAALPGREPQSPPPTAKTRPAPRVVTLQTSDYADAWPHKPDAGGAPVGLRLVGEETIENAERQALETVARVFADADMPPDLLEIRGGVMLEQYNNELMVNVLAHALCKADDAKSHFFPKAPQAVIPQAFHPGTIQMLWREYDALRMVLSPMVRLATDEELAAIMPDPAMATNRLRRLVALVHEELDVILAEE